MSRARHKNRAAGGGLSSKPVWNAGGGQNAAKEAEEKKHGGKVHGEGEKAKERHDRPRRARGGKVEHHKHGGHVKHEHEHAHGGTVEHEHSGKVMHHHIPGRKRGGGVGADKTPLTTAAKVKHVTPGETPEEGEPMD